jgi:hypothetical protein
MPRYQIPKNVGEVEVVLTMAGTYAVFSKKSGRHGLRIPCRDRTQAEEICRRIREKDHAGEIWV